MQSVTLSNSYTDPHKYPSGVAFQDGQYILVAEAKISVLDYGFLHSDATYDTVHVWDGAFFRLDDHIDRFLSGVARLRMQLPLSKEDIRDILHRCVALSGHRRAYVEMICTRGTSDTFSRDPRDARNRFIAFAVPYGSVANDKQMRCGLHVSLVDTMRIPPESVDPSLKNYHWLDLIMGLYGAYDKGGETALLMDSRGNVSEGPGFNVFAFREGKGVTPDRGVLPGITRRTVIEICAEHRIQCECGTLSPDDLRQADEVFATSTAGGIMPITRINGAPVKDGKVGRMTKELRDIYWSWHRDERFKQAISFSDR